VTPLPNIMVAPNGARRTKVDHPALPINLSEIVETARQCYLAGAGGLHAHVRDTAGKHILDAGIYRELLAEMALAVPDMLVQITTEAVGSYSPVEQRKLVRDVRPEMVSVALCEMVPDGAQAEAADFYHWAHDEEIAVQHILYDQTDIEALDRLLQEGQIPHENLQALLVLGRYTVNQVSNSKDLPPLVNALTTAAPDVDWAVCAFGQNETACLRSALAHGGKVRVGFENNLFHADGQVAADNSSRVREISTL
tara:strand:+ start:6839 stop:7597 length:759 start_codon:yes stop_codon:yes gene_type:complete